MKSHLILACALALPCAAWASDHGPVFSYATPVTWLGDVSLVTGIFGGGGWGGTQLSTGSGFGYGVTPHLTLTFLLPGNVRQRLSLQKAA